jgi:hypothetical protein
MDHGPLSAFLEQHGVDAGRRDQMIGDVMNAICRYGHAQESELLKSHLENFVAAAGKLEAAMPKLGSIAYVQFSSAILSALPPAEPTAANERVRRFSDLALTLAMIRAGAADGLEKLRSKSGRPKRKFVNELKASWVRGTGKKPGVSGRTTFKTPVAVFMGLFSDIFIAATRPATGPPSRSHAKNCAARSCGTAIVGQPMTRPAAT